MHGCWSRSPAGAGTPPTIAVYVSLLVCLIPTTIGGLLSAIGIAGMDRLIQHNVLAMSGRAVEAAGDVNTLLLDKTGTITLGNRQAAEFIPEVKHTIAVWNMCRRRVPGWRAPVSWRPARGRSSTDCPPESLRLRRSRVRRR